METIPNNKESCVKWLKEHNIDTTCNDKTCK